MNTVMLMLNLITATAEHKEPVLKPNEHVQTITKESLEEFNQSLIWNNIGKKDDEGSK